MNRRDILAYVSTAAMIVSRAARAQPLPVISNSVPPGTGPGPLTSGGAPPSLDLSFMSGTLDPSLTFTRGSTATYFDSGGVMRTAATNAPRFDYDPVTHAALGLLIEEQRTNVQTFSADFTQWTVSNTNIIAASGTAPDGTNTMTKLNETNLNTTHFIYRTATTVASTTYTASVFAKAVQSRYMQFILDDTSANGAFATFDLQAGTITGPLTARGAGVIGTAVIQAVGNGVYRCAISTTISTATTARQAILLSNVAAPAFAPVYTGTLGNGVLIWGAQLEQGAFPTSYIPTTAAAVTRSADVCTAATTPWYNTTTAAGTLQAEALLPVLAANNFWQMCAVIDDNTNNNRVQLFRAASSNDVYGQISRLGVDAYNPLIGTQAAGSAWKCAIAYQSGAQSSAFNGVLGPGNTAAMSPIAMTLLHIGHNAGPGLFANGYIRRVRYWPRVLSNAELQSVTT